MDEYCKNHEENDYCNRVNQLVSESFCKIACKGNYEIYKQLSLEDARARWRDMNSSVDDGEMVSVVIPCWMDDEQYLSRTVSSIKDNAIGRLEILTEMDTYDEGHRVLTNRAVEKAKGKYILRIDAHCAMSPGWDARMKTACNGDVIVKPMLDGLDVDTWMGHNRDMGMVVWNKRFRNRYPYFWKPFPARDVEEESLSLIGCCFLLEKRYYDKLGGCDESLSKWGGFGLEWALKTWLTGGRVAIRTDCVCYHLFREAGKIPFQIDQRRLDETFLSLGKTWSLGLGKGQTRPMAWLISRFHQDLKRAVEQPPSEQRTRARYAVAENTL